MKTRSIALGAVLMCASAAQAQSNVQVSGLVDVYAGSVHAPGGQRKGTVGSGGLTTSWWGISGTEDLGNGLKAGFALGAFMRADEGTPGRFNGDAFFARDANVSLSGQWGTVKLGRAMAPNFLPTILFNPFGDSFTVSPLVMHANMANQIGVDHTTTASDTGWSNQVTYSTPAWKGVSANVHYQFGEQASKRSAANIGVNVLYRQGPLGLTAFYETADALGNPNPSYTAGAKNTNWMVGGSYDLGVAKLYATYGKADKERASAQLVEQKTYSLGADVPVTKAGTIKLAYAHTKTDWADQAQKSKRQTVSLGYDHFLSKRTDVYAVLMRDKNDLFERSAAAASGTSFIVGMRHRF